MKTQRWYPSAVAEQPEWNENFYTKLPGLLATLTTVPTAHADACVASLKYMNYVIGSWRTAVRELGPAATSAIELLLFGSGPAPVALPTFTAPTLPTGVAGVPPGVLVRLFALVRIIKADPNYTEAIGRDLGIIGSEDATEHPYPDFSLTLEAGSGNQQVRIDFTKYGHQGVWIESRVNNGAWAFLAIDTLKPYTDARALAVPGQPETREYRMRWYDAGDPSGDWTPVQRTSVGA